MKEMMWLLDIVDTLQYLLTQTLESLTIKRNTKAIFWLYFKSGYLATCSAEIYSSVAIPG